MMDAFTELAIWGAPMDTTPRVIPYCPACDKPAPVMPLSDYLRMGGPPCCGTQTTISPPEKFDCDLCHDSGFEQPDVPCHACGSHGW